MTDIDVKPAARARFGTIVVGLVLVLAAGVHATPDNCQGTIIGGNLQCAGTCSDGQTTCPPPDTSGSVLHCHCDGEAAGGDPCVTYQVLLDESHYVVRCGNFACPTPNSCTPLQIMSPEGVPHEWCQCW
ncbi:MAG: hypothetical protein H6825_05435 [Planctomycetes bacterium]|nr:hypothetical protein [Planctomycetota bacterium]